MHTWAAIEHKLGYKSNQELPKNLKRKLYLMSAQLENADMQFQEIKNDAENFQHTIVEESKESGNSSFSIFFAFFAALLHKVFIASGVLEDLEIVFKHSNKISLCFFIISNSFIFTSK